MKKIVITGPESTGKTTLAKQLSKKLKCEYTPEFAREYVEKLSRKYKKKDLVEIAKGQLDLERKAKTSRSSFIVCDTSFLVIKIWSEYKYGGCNSLIIKWLKQNTPDLYILCKNDFPWEFDIQRENPNPIERKELYEIYRQEIIKSGVPYIEVFGPREERLNMALKKIHKMKTNQTYLEKIYNPEKFRKQGHELIDLIADSLSKSISKDKKVINWEEPEKELAFWEKYQLEPKDFSELMKNIIERSIKVHHPNYMGHQVAPPMPTSILAGLTSNFLNNGMAIYEMGAASTAIEKLVIKKFTNAFELGKNADGYLTSGGTLANLTALLAARKAIAKSDVWSEGNKEKLALMVSEEAHYCIDRAARIMGFGTEGIIKIASDSNFSMDTSKLEEEYQKAEAKGFKIIAVVGSACTTSTGSYDDLEVISAFCKEKSIWFHVDGAHGAAVIFSPKYKHLIKGINQADSLILDGHKMLGSSALITAVLFKNSSCSYANFHQKAQYLWADAESPDWFNIGKRSFECTKSMMSIKLFAVMQEYGIKAFDAYVSHLYDLGNELASYLKEQIEFELANSPKTNIVCFRLFDENKTEEELNVLNRRVREKMLEIGEYYIVQTVLRNKVYLRVTLMSPYTTMNDLKKMLELVKKI